MEFGSCPSLTLCSSHLLSCVFITLGEVVWGVWNPSNPIAQGWSQQRSNWEQGATCYQGQQVQPEHADKIIVQTEKKKSKEKSSIWHLRIIFSWASEGWKSTALVQFWEPLRKHAVSNHFGCSQGITWLERRKRNSIKNRQRKYSKWLSCSQLSEKIKTTENTFT